MELLYYIFYTILILGPLLIAAVMLVALPVWYLLMAAKMVQRYGTFGVKAVGCSLAVLVVGYALKPPVLYLKIDFPDDYLKDWTLHRKGLASPPASPDETLDFMQTMFSLIGEPPVFLYVGVIGSFFLFRWFLRWQPQETSSD